VIRPEYPYNLHNRLTLNGTKVSDAGDAELQKALPNCKIKN
tara:strand:- start:13 stop:135 length:123 start_codon:yes stop_codon:yes gene_type:complete